MRSALATRNTSLDPINTIRAQTRQSKLIASIVPLPLDLSKEMSNGQLAMTLSKCGLPSDEAASLLKAVADELSGPVQWRELLRLLKPTHPFEAHRALFQHAYRSWDDNSRGPAPCWFPSPALLQRSSVLRFIKTLSHPAWKPTGELSDDIAALNTFAVSKEGREHFWRHAVNKLLRIQFTAPPRAILELDSKGDPMGKWFPGAMLNVAELCCSHPDRAPGEAAVMWSTEGDPTVRRWSLGELRARLSLIAHSLRAGGVQQGQKVAGVLPFSAEAVAIYIDRLHRLVWGPEEDRYEQYVRLCNKSYDRDDDVEYDSETDTDDIKVCLQFLSWCPVPLFCYGPFPTLDILHSILVCCVVAGNVQI